MNKNKEYYTTVSKKEDGLGFNFKNVTFPDVFKTTERTWYCILTTRGDFTSQNARFTSGSSCGWMLVSFNSTNSSWGELWFFNDHFVKIPRNEGERFEVAYGDSNSRSFNLAWCWKELINVVPHTTLAIWKDFFVKGCPADYKEVSLNKGGVYLVYDDPKK